MAYSTGKKNDEHTAIELTELMPEDVSKHFTAQAAFSTTSPSKPLRAANSNQRWQLWRSRFLLSSTVIISAIPLVLLLAFSKQLSHRLGSNGCLPNGQFVIPYTTSVWNPANIFDITVAFVDHSNDGCSYSTQDGLTLGASSGEQCTGYSFNAVRVIDLAFDVLVGRAGQALVTYISYYVFSRVLTALMQEGEIAYSVYTAVAFRSSSFMGVWDVMRCAFGKTPYPTGRRARWIYACIAMAILYILTIPTFVSATTGYLKYSVPYMDNSTSGLPDRYTNCGGQISPAFGWLNVNSKVYDQYNRSTAFNGNHVIPYTLLEETYDRLDWQGYYARYKHIYDACADEVADNKGKLANCSEAQVWSWVSIGSGSNLINETIAPPLADIITYPADASNYRFTTYACADEVLDTRWLGAVYRLPNSTDDDVQYVNIKAVCIAGEGYLWGFSFVLAFIFLVILLVFTTMLTLIWILTSDMRARCNGRTYGLLKDATIVVAAAQAQYGEDIADWSGNRLRKDVERGKAGMTWRKSATAVTYDETDDLSRAPSP